MEDAYEHLASDLIVAFDIRPGQVNWTLDYKHASSLRRT